MNKKIDELANRANIKWMIGNGPGGACIFYDVNDFYKFAKSLIEECALAAEQHARSYSDGDAGAGCYGAAAAIRNIGKND